MDNDVLKVWNSFKQEIMYKNRYFFNHDIINLLSEIKDIRMFGDGVKLNFFRTREGNHVNDNISEIMGPPAGKASAGRCNPEGVSYLYLSSDEKTAIKELITHKKDIKNVTIAKFDVDVSNIFSFLPYKFSYMEDYIVNDKVKILIEIINSEMEKIINEEEKIKYVPLQFISEYVKYIGYDGFTYSSVVGTGMNLVMFNTNKVSIIKRYEKIL